MTAPSRFLQGEYRRTLDDRYRLSIPPPLIEQLTADGKPAADAELVLIKECSGCVSLWVADLARRRLEDSLRVIRDKLQAGLLHQRLDRVQTLGRLLSSRQTPVSLAGRGRLVIPESFRTFLGIEPGGEAMVVGAALCIEIWHPDRWVENLEEGLPQFQRLLDELAQ